MSVESWRRGGGRVAAGRALREVACRRDTARWVGARLEAMEMLLDVRIAASSQQLRGEGDWHQNAGSFCDSGGLRGRRNRVKIEEQSGPPYPKIEM